MKMAVTIKDIAKVGGVSYSTVSRALNDSPLITDKTKKHIRKIAEDLGFEFNANARYMITSKTGTIGIIYPEEFEDFGAHLYYSSLHTQMRKSLEEMDLDPIISFPKNRHCDKDNIKRLIGSHKVDGLIIAQPVIDPETIDYLKESKVPFVFFHHPTLLTDVDEIIVDHYKGGYLAAKHLLEKGRKQILCLSGGDALEFQQRIIGYQNALKEFDISYPETHVITINQSFDASYDTVSNLFNETKPYDAIFATTDLLAWGAMNALRDKGYHVPNDVSIVGYDDVEIARYLSPELTTIHQPREEIAVLTCERLKQKLSSNSVYKIPQKILIEPKLIVRSST